MPRYQTASQWASEETKPPSGWVSAATTHTATRVKRSVCHAARQASERASARAATRVREVASYAMPTPDSYNAASFVNEHGRELTAIGTVIGAFVIAQLVDRALARRGRRLAGVMVGDLSPVP